MQIKQVAELLNVDPKEVVREVEARRDEYTDKGYRLAKKLNTGSALDQELVKHILASFDTMRQAAAEKEKVEEDRRKREEDERRRAAEDLKRKKEQEEQRLKAEAARKAAEAELARRQAEIAAARAREEAAARQAAEAAAAAAQSTAQPVVSAPPPAPVPPSIPAAPVASAPASTPVGPGMPVMPRPFTQRPQQPGQSTMPSSAPVQRVGAQQAPPSMAAPQQTEQRPRTEHRPGGDRGRPGGRPGGGPSGRPGGPGGEGRGEHQGRPGGPGGPRGRDERHGDRPSGRPGGDRGDSRGGNRGRRGPGVGPSSRDERPASVEGLQAFVAGGMEANLVDETKKRDRTARRPNRPAKAGGDEDKDFKAGKRAKPPVTDDGRKRIRPSQIFNLEAMIERRPKLKRKGAPGARGGEDLQKPEGPKVIRISGDFTVGQFADKLEVPVSDVMKKLFERGDMMTINQLLDPDKAEELAIELGVEIEVIREDDRSDVADFVEVEYEEGELVPRPPVVTVMGHVDHGKTSLLDRIRKADVAAHEFGGITQHIGAYNVSTAKGDIVFLDTPGHEAFTEMRSRGANVTDLVVLVVAANDGVMPQTVEAINHARAAKVPILVAINKVDVDGANIERVKQELMRYDLVPEEFGGDTIMIKVSALTGQGVDELLEYIALQTEILELKANPNRPALGTVIESHVDPLRGSLATVLVREGTLRIGDYFVCGTEYGRIRAMRDDRGGVIKEAGPARPVEILGLRGSPSAGETFVVTPTESEARDVAERRIDRRKIRRTAVVKPQVSLDNLAEQVAEGEILTINLILKGDVQGSVEAISNALMKIKSDKVLVRILHAAVGAVSTSDVQLADASRAIILGFNVSTDPSARDQAEEMGVSIRTYQIIYALLEDIEKAMMGMLAPEFEEKQEGRARVLQTFKISKIGTVAGCFVEEGAFANTHRVRLIRNGSVIWRGKIKSLRRVKDEVKQVVSGLECGIGLENYNDVKEGDILEAYSMVEQAVSLISSDSNRRPESVGSRGD